MLIPLSKINLFDIIDFNNSFSVAEKKEIEDTLAREIWFRILEEKVPSLVDNKKLQRLSEHTKGKDLDFTIESLLKEFPKLNIKLLLDTTSTEVKQDYIATYIDEIKGKLNKPVIDKYLSSIREQAEKGSIDTTLIKRDHEGLRRYLKKD